MTLHFRYMCVIILYLLYIEYDSNHSPFSLRMAQLCGEIPFLYPSSPFPLASIHIILEASQPAPKARLYSARGENQSLGTSICERQLPFNQQPTAEHDPDSL